jgi:hypothetical protein
VVDYGETAEASAFLGDPNAVWASDTVDKEAFSSVVSLAYEYGSRDVFFGKVQRDQYNRLVASRLVIGYPMDPEGRARIVEHAETLQGVEVIYRRRGVEIVAQ